MNEPEARRLIDEYADIILKVSYTYLKQRTDAEDICQTVFMKYLARDMRFTTREHEKAWIIRTTVNACKDHLKSAFKKRTVSMDESHDTMADAGEFTADRELRELIDRLHHMQGLSIYLFYYEGYSIKEIAQILRKSDTAVAAYLSRGRRTLREYLSDDTRDAEHVRLAE